MAGHSGAHIVEDGLIMCLDAANPKSYPGTGDTWFDVSGNENNATLVNSPLYEDNLFKFNGTNSYVNTNFIWSNLYLGGSFMVLGFNSSGTAITQGQHSGKRFYWDLGTNGLYHGVQNKFLNGGAHGIAEGAPFSFASTYAGGTTADLYVNKVKKQTMTGISNDPAYSPVSPWYIAAGVDGSGTINGHRDYSIGLVLFYDRGITADEVAQNFEAFKSRYGL